ncbi:MAG: hypothetical protein KKF44_07995 [Nanoarchaeota archaeon]|nr:hypothetical protein [Nanoarchaeota archaeon]
MKKTILFSIIMFTLIVGIAQGQELVIEYNPADWQIQYYYVTDNFFARVANTGGAEILFNVEIVAEYYDLSTETAYPFDSGYVIFSKYNNVNSIMTYLDGQLLSENQIILCNYNDVCEPCIESGCKVSENTITCIDCTSGKPDNICIPGVDNICDPDCIDFFDPDCIIPEVDEKEASSVFSDRFCNPSFDEVCDPDCEQDEDPDCNADDGNIIVIDDPVEEQRDSCGNQICEKDENYDLCPLDCSRPIEDERDLCGDGICSGKETDQSCASDCRENKPKNMPEETGSKNNEPWKSALSFVLLVTVIAAFVTILFSLFKKIKIENNEPKE